VRELMGRKPAPATWGFEMAAVPSWLRAKVTPSRRGVTVAKCRDCKAPILTGLQDDMAAHVVKVNATPLSRMGELAALMLGLRTYELRRHQQTLALWQRDRWQIKGRDPGIKFDVVTDHVCFPTSLPSMRSVYHTPEKAKDSDECPY
jgi:hypothetical protein